MQSWGDGAAIGAELSAGDGVGASRLGEVWLRLRHAFAAAFELEVSQRRLFLWLPVAAGAGVVLYFGADREPSLGYAGLLAAGASVLAFALRRWRLPFAVALVFAAVTAGFFSATWRSYRLAAPVLDHVAVVKLTGTVEEMDLRRVGARFVLRVAQAQGLQPEETPLPRAAHDQGGAEGRGGRLHLHHGAPLAALARRAAGRL